MLVNKRAVTKHMVLQYYKEPVAAPTPLVGAQVVQAAGSSGGKRLSKRQKVR